MGKVNKCNELGVSRGRELCGATNACVKTATVKKSWRGAPQTGETEAGRLLVSHNSGDRKCTDKSTTKP